MEHILLKAPKDSVELWLPPEWFVVHVNRPANTEKVKKSTQGTKFAPTEWEPKQLCLKSAECYKADLYAPIVHSIHMQNGHLQQK